MTHSREIWANRIAGMLAEYTDAVFRRDLDDLVEALGDARLRFKDAAPCRGDGIRDFHRGVFDAATTPAMHVPGPPTIRVVDDECEFRSPYIRDRLTVDGPVLDGAGFYEGIARAVDARTWSVVELRIRDARPSH